MKTLSIHAAVVLTACVTLAEAQVPEGLQGSTQMLLLQSLSTTPSSYCPLPPPRPHRCRPCYRGPGTAQSAFLHGWADLIRAMGQYNVNASVAMRHFEEARSRNMDNQMKWVATYHAKRELNRAYRAASRSRRSTGDIAFPPALMSHDFRRYRTRLYSVAAKEAGGRSISASEWEQLFNMTNWAQRKLGQSFRGTAHFGLADNFLRTVAKHAQNHMA